MADTGGVNKTSKGERRLDDGNTGIIDNKNVIFEDVFKKYCNNITELKIAVGYFYVSGFDLVKENLRQIDKIKIVMGDETDEYTKRQIEKGYDEKIKYLLHRELEDMNENDESQISTLKELHDFIEQDKLEIRVHDHQKFHAKAYIFHSDNDDRLDTAIIGSSNFSKYGMSEGGNIELNSIHSDHPDLNILNKWYDSIWDNSSDFKSGMLKTLKTSQPYIRKIDGDMDYLSPLELFKIMVYEILDKDVSMRDDVLARFQQIGYINALTKLERFNGCIISDSVGLGKTFIGLKLVENAQKQDKNVLLVVPKNVKNNWENEMSRKNTSDVKNFLIDQNESRLKIMTVTELSNYNLADPKDKVILDNTKANYQFIVLDEAHRFRNDGKFMDGEYSGNKNYANLRYMSTEDKQYVLLTATPLNNSILDLHNLLSIFINENILFNYDSDLQFSDFSEYQRIRKKLEKEKSSDIYDQVKIVSLKQDLEKHLSGISRILEEVMILRTRTEISQKYPDLIIGGKSISFILPKINPRQYAFPESYASIYTNIVGLLSNLSVPHMSLINENAGITLSGLYKILLFKRLESSIHAFAVSLKRLRSRELDLLKDIEENGWEETKKQRRNNTKYDLDFDNDPELEDIISNHSIRDDSTDSKSEQEVISMIKEDIRMIDDFTIKFINKIWKSGYKYDDPKINQLNDIIRNNHGKKILIFSQYVDTVEYIHENFKLNSIIDGLVIDCVTGSDNTYVIGSKLDVSQKIKLFAPVANHHEMIGDEKEIDILISTDSIAEGVNLQDCSIVVNYDLPWNPMRMIQRVGRVDRIGSMERTNVFNILPDKELDIFLELVTKLTDKIKRIATIIGKESYILTEDEVIDPKTIGEAIKNIKNAASFDVYEKLGKNTLLKNIHGNEHYALQILKLRSIIENLGLTSHNFKRYSNSSRPPYSIIRAKYFSGFFTMFRVFDKVKKDKLENITLYYDLKTNSFKKMDIDDLSLHEFTSGISRAHAPTPPDLDKLLETTKKHFEMKYFEKIREGYRKSKLPDSKSMSLIQKRVIVQLDNIRKTEILDQIDIQNEIRNKAQFLYNRFIEYNLHRTESRILTELFQELNDTGSISKNDNEKIVSVLDEFYEGHIVGNSAYTPLRNANDIDYKMICWGAFV